MKLALDLEERSNPAVSIRRPVDDILMHDKNKDGAVYLDDSPMSRQWTFFDGENSSFSIHRTNPMSRRNKFTNRAWMIRIKDYSHNPNNESALFSISYLNTDGDLRSKALVLNHNGKIAIKQIDTLGVEAYLDFVSDTPDNGEHSIVLYGGSYSGDTIQLYVDGVKDTTEYSYDELDIVGQDIVDVAIGMCMGPYHTGEEKLRAAVRDFRILDSNQMTLPGDFVKYDNDTLTQVPSSYLWYGKNLLYGENGGSFNNGTPTALTHYGYDATIMQSIYNKFSGEANDMLVPETGTSFVSLANDWTIAFRIEGFERVVHGTILTQASPAFDIQLANHGHIAIGGVASASSIPDRFKYNIVIRYDKSEDSAIININNGTNDVIDTTGHDFTLNIDSIGGTSSVIDGFRGVLADFRVYSKLLTDTQTQDYINNKYIGTPVLWIIDTYHGYDISGNNHHAKNTYGDVIKIKQGLAYPYPFGVDKALKSLLTHKPVYYPATEGNSYSYWVYNPSGGTWTEITGTIASDERLSVGLGTNEIAKNIKINGKPVDTNLSEWYGDVDYYEEYPIPADINGYCVLNNTASKLPDIPYDNKYVPDIGIEIEFNKRRYDNLTPNYIVGSYIDMFTDISGASVGEDNIRLTGGGTKTVSYASTGNILDTSLFHYLIFETFGSGIGSGEYSKCFIMGVNHTGNTLLDDRGHSIAENGWHIITIYDTPDASTPKLDFALQNVSIGKTMSIRNISIRGFNYLDTPADLLCLNKFSVIGNALGFPEIFDSKSLTYKDFDPSSLYSYSVRELFSTNMFVFIKDKFKLFTGETNYKGIQLNSVLLYSAEKTGNELKRIERYLDSRSADKTNTGIIQNEIEYDGSIVAVDANHRYSLINEDDEIARIAHNTTGSDNVQTMRDLSFMGNDMVAHSTASTPKLRQDEDGYYFDFTGLTYPSSDIYLDVDYSLYDYELVVEIKELTSNGIRIGSTTTGAELYFTITNTGNLGEVGFSGATGTPSGPINITNGDTISLVTNKTTKECNVFINDALAFGIIASTLSTEIASLFKIGEDNISHTGEIKLSRLYLKGGNIPYANTKYCTFDGINQYIACGNGKQYDYNKPHSYSFVFKTSSLAFQGIYAKMLPTLPYTGVMIYMQNGNLYTYIIHDFSTERIKLHTTATFNDNKFHFGIITYDGSGTSGGISIYIDSSVPQSTIIDSNNIISHSVLNNSNIFIGKSYSSAGVFEGMLDEPNIIGREVPQSDIVQLIGNQSGNFDPTKMGDIKKVAGADLDMYYPLGDRATYDSETGQWTFPNVANPSYPGTSQNMTDANVHQYNDSGNTDYVLEFDTNTDNRVGIPSDVVFDNLTAFTISIDFYAYSVSGNSFVGNCLVSRGISTSGFWLALGNVNSHFKIGQYNANYLLSDAINPTLNAWNNMKIVWDGATATFYYNNVAMGSGAVSNTGLASASSPIYVGGYINPSPQYFDGKLDNFLMFGRALDPSEFDNIMDVTNGLLIKQKFNEGEGLTTADLSGNGYNGTLIGSSIIPKWWKR